MAQGNPLFNEKAYRQTLSQPVRVGEEMTLQGTINKTFCLLFLCMAGGIITFNHYTAVAGATNALAFITFVLGLVIIFKKSTAPLLAPVYAIGQGIVMGVVSAVYNAAYQGIVAQAILVTLAVFAIMLFIYRTGLIKVNRSFMIGIVAATGGIALFYIVSMLLMMFGVQVAYFTSNSTWAIAINAFICIIAAMNFLIDFKFVDQLTSEVVAPKYMEWYAAFSLLLTLIWLYIEILRLLGRSRNR